MKNPQSQAGFTLLETMIVFAVMIPILGGILATNSTISHTIDSNTRAADVITSCRVMSQRIAKLVRPAQKSTIRTPAIASDVTNGIATAIGDWISPTDLVWRPGIEFRSASGLLSMNAALLTTPRRIEFTPDPLELDNGIDDDGDGLIDEGEVVLLQNTITLAILRDVEDCRFSLDGRVLHMRLRIGRRDQQGRVYRSLIEQQFYVRNN